MKKKTIILPEVTVTAKMPSRWRNNVEMKKQNGESENDYIERMTSLSLRRHKAIKNVNRAQHQAAKDIFEVAKQPAYFVPGIGNAVLAGDVAGQVLNKDYIGAVTTLGTVGALKYGTPYLIKGTLKAVQSAKNAFDNGMHIGDYYINIPKNSNYAYRIMRDIEALDVLNGQPLRLGRTNPAKAVSDDAAIAKELTARKGPVLYKSGAEHGGRKLFAKGMPWGGTTVTNGEPVVLRIKGNGLDWKPGRHFKGNRDNLTFESAPVGSHIDLQANPETGLTTVVPSLMEGSELFYKNKLFGKNFGYKRVKVGNPNTVSSAILPSTAKPAYKITSENAANITPEQWTAAQDAAIARGDMAEAQRLRDLHSTIHGKPIVSYRGQFPDKIYTRQGLNPYSDTRLSSRSSGYFSSTSKPVADTYKWYLDSPLFKLYTHFKNPKIIDAKGLNWESVGTDKIYNTMDVLHDGIIIKNVMDVGPARTNLNGASDIADDIIATPGKSKLADAVTYDNLGMRIPLGERDNFNINDIRYAIFPFVGGGVGYGLYNALSRESKYSELKARLDPQFKYKKK